MLPPKLPLVPLRSGEIAPFHAKSELLPTLPDWSRVPSVGLISYQRSSDPGPPYTACAVQTATAPPFLVGSTAATAASLPHARFRLRGGGRGAGDDAARVAVARPLRGP